MKPAMVSATALVAYNALVVAVYAWDKRQATRRGRRVRERTLLLLAATFGSVGAFLGMRVFRHKTRKPAFAITVPVLVVVHLAAVSWFVAKA